MPRRPKKYHYIYKTTNIITNKFYIGMHSTDNLNDGYIGSGKRLWYSINKYGKENHICEILEYLPDRELLRKREEEIVNSDLIKEDLCMNLVVGGEGRGFDYINENGLNVGKNNTSHFEGRTQPQTAKDTLSALQKERVQDKRYKKFIVDTLIKNRSVGHKHTDETKIQMSKCRKGLGAGNKNSQFGTCWIYSLDKQKCKKIPLSELDDFLSLGWIKGRKMKF